MKIISLGIKNIIAGVCLSTIAVLSSCSKSDSAAAQASSNTGKGGSLARFTIIGDYLYIAELDSLKTVNISDPAMPVHTSSQKLGFFGDAETIYPFRNLLFIGSQSGMFIYSLADPQNPVLEGSARHVRACDPVVTNDSIAFVTLRNGRSCGGSVNELQIYDIADINRPNMIHKITLGGPYGLGLLGSILYVCDDDNGLVVIDVSNPHAVRIIDKIKGFKFRDCIPHNDILLCMTDKGMVLYDISILHSPEFIAEIL